jgi:light-regulated signal transduction histidine kinase (bacteriophytochrome)
VERQRNLAPNRTLTIKTIGAVPTVEVDSVRIEQVLNHLLSNALKYSPDESAVDLEVRQVEDDVQCRFRIEGQAYRHRSCRSSSIVTTDHDLSVRNTDQAATRRQLSSNLVVDRDGLTAP